MLCGAVRAMDTLLAELSITTLRLAPRLLVSEEAAFQQLLIDI